MRLVLYSFSKDKKMMSSQQDQKKEFVPIVIRIVEQVASHHDHLYTDFVIAQQPTFQAIKYLVQHRAISDSISSHQHNKQLEVVEVSSSIVSEFALKNIFDILTVMNSKIPTPGKVNSNSPRDAVGPQMYELLSKFNNDELENLYSAAHFLSMRELRLNIACFFAALVFIEPSFQHFEKLKQNLGVKAVYNYQYSLSMAAKEEEYSAIK